MAEITDPYAAANRSSAGLLHNVVSAGLLSTEPPAALRCCCGQANCIFLQHNCSVLESVENDVRTAAKLGQSLLERHEAYIADAERDRAELIDRIGRLEMDKKELETENALKIEENRALLDQLESLNTTVSDSDTRVKFLEATLQSSQQIIRRLEGAAERAEDMERHLTALEAEQATLQNSLVTSESEARSAIQRWRRAERGIADLQFQLDKMEKETREERERHMEIMGRVERQRAVERELNTAAGRLKGAAAAKSLQDSKAGGSGVVTHFVRDLLQDNASLQLGLAELRGMLMNSNDEIQLLRDQLMFHQPLAEANVSAASTLRAELETEAVLEIPEKSGPAGLPATPGSPESPERPGTRAGPVTPRSYRHAPSLSQEFHIHHHYHLENSKRAEPKRPRRKRLSLTPAIFTPPAANPTTPLSRSLGVYPDVSSVMGDSPSHARRLSSRHMSRDSASTANSGPSNRWSVFSDQPSDFTMSSVPSSPRTNPRNSIFDRSCISDLSIPPSPTTSVDAMSPMGQMFNRAQEPDESLVCSFPPSLDIPPSSPELPQQPLSIVQDEEDEEDNGDAPPPSIVVAEMEPADAANMDQTTADFAAEAETGADELALSEATTPTPTQDTTFARFIADATTDGEAPCTPPPRHRPLRRAVSHESIMSPQGGLDIHTLKVRPSQLALRPLGTPPAALADTGVSSVMARPVISRGGSDLLRNHALLLDSLSLGLPTPRAKAVPGTASSDAASKNASTSGTNNKAFSKLVAWRPWGGNNSSTADAAKPGVEPAVSNAPEPNDTATTPITTTDTNTTTTDSSDKFRKDTGGKSAASHPSIGKFLQEMRAPGINQPGAIPGFLEYWSAQPRRGAPSKVEPDGVDHDALREGLGGE